MRPSPASDAVVQAVERATVEAVSPDQVCERTGWLLPMDGGTIGRAHSAVPLSHDPKRLAEQVADVPDVVAAYRARGLQPVFRLPDAATALHRVVAALGAQPCEPAWVMLGQVSDLAALAGTKPLQGVVVAVEERPSAGWQSLYLGEGFDPTDGACRVRNLSRAACNRYVTAWCDGVPVACGVAALAHGWMGVHGMRTALTHRGRGLASRVLHAMAGLARQHGIERVFLQVGQANEPAQRLYQRAGLVRAWGYAYWRLPA